MAEALIRRRKAQTHLGCTAGGAGATQVGFLEEGALQGHLGGGVSLGSSKEEHPRRSKGEKSQRWGKRGDFRALKEMGDGRVTKGKSNQCSPLGTRAHPTVFLGGI